MAHVGTRERFSLRPEQVRIPPGHGLRRLPAVGAGAAVVGLGAALALAAGDPRRFYFSWLLAFLFWLSLALGALYFVLIHHAMQGAWGVVVRRLAENAMVTIPVFAVLFVPVVLGAAELFPWAAPGAAAHDRLLQWKEPYLNRSFFLLRAAVFFVAWSAIAFWFYRSSRAQDATGDPGVSARLRRFSGPAVAVVGLTQSFAAFDWIMSLTPHWYSTMFGVYYFAGSLVGYFSLMAIVAVALERSGVLRDILRVDHLHDIGKLVFAFTCFWAYIAFSQFFLVWYGNLPEETVWYQVRLDGGWQVLSAVLAIGHFVIPFFFFLGRRTKRTARMLVAGAAWVLLMHLLDVYWLVIPAAGVGARPALSDLAALLAVGGFFVAAASWITLRQAVVPIRDPRLAESLMLENP